MRAFEVVKLQLLYCFFLDAGQVASAINRWDREELDMLVSAASSCLFSDPYPFNLIVQCHANYTEFWISGYSNAFIWENVPKSFFNVYMS